MPRATATIEQVSHAKASPANGWTLAWHGEKTGFLWARERGACSILAARLLTQQDPKGARCEGSGAPRIHETWQAHSATASPTRVADYRLPPNAWLVRLTCAEMAACLGTRRRSREDTARAMVAPLRQGKLSHEGFDPPAEFAQDTVPFPVWG